MQNSTKDIFIKILNFYQYELNENYISLSVDINSKENYLKYFGNKSNNSIRFAKKEMFDNGKIIENLKNNDLFNETIANFNYLKEIN